MKDILEKVAEKTALQEMRLKAKSKKQLRKQ